MATIHGPVSIGDCHLEIVEVKGPSSYASGGFAVPTKLHEVFFASVLPSFGILSNNVLARYETATGKIRVVADAPLLHGGEDETLAEISAGSDLSSSIFRVMRIGRL